MGSLNDRVINRLGKTQLFLKMSLGRHTWIDRINEL